MWQKVIRQDGVETIAGECTEAEARAWLTAKEASHIAHGWTTRRLNDEMVAAHKDYEHRHAKDRIILIRER